MWGSFLEDVRLEVASQTKVPLIGSIKGFKGFRFLYSLKYVRFVLTYLKKCNPHF